MRRIQRILSAGPVIAAAILLASGLPASARADTADVPSLVISQLKVTSSNGQFVTLYNSTDTPLDMSKYRLEYFNNYDLGKATSSKLIVLSGSVPPHGYFMVNDSSLLLCYQVVVDSVSLDMSSTAGTVEVVDFGQSGAGPSKLPVLQDVVGWSKTAATGAQTLPSNTNAFLQRQPLDSNGNPSVKASGGGSWQNVQPDAANPCNLIISKGGGQVQTGLQQLLPATEPAATILTLGGSDDSAVKAASLPSADIGLMAPMITELLPNPAGTGNDSQDEFIELYNPNEANFDLSGFSLQSGTTTLHKYSFPDGVSLPPHSFKAFYSSATGLTLSNSGSQAKLLDPFGNSVSASGIYGSAKDGVAWALANSKWYWTTRPTPDGTNIIDQPLSKKKTTAKAAAKSASKKVHAAKASAKTKKSKKHLNKQVLSPQNAQNESLKTNIHTGVLALVGAAALLYGAYEYRADLANCFYRLRRYFASRRSDRPAA